MTAASIETRTGLRFGRGFWSAVAAEVWSDRLIYGLVGAYAVAAAVAAYVAGAPEKLVYFAYFAIWPGALVSVGLAILTIVEIPASVRADPKAPLARLKARIPDILNPRLIAGLGVMLALIVAMGTFTSVKNMLLDFTQFRWDEQFAALDATLAGGQDPWLRLQPILGHLPVTRAIQLLYAPGWMLAVCGVPALIAASRRLAHLRTRFFITYLFCWVVLGNILAGVFMSAGPIYFGEITGDAARFAPQIAYLADTAGQLHSSYDIANTLWSLHDAGRVELATGISAFPSLHVAMATLLFLTGATIHRWAGVLGAVFLLIILVGSVHLGWHYAVDGYASFAAVVSVWFGAGWLQRRFSRP